MSDILVKFSTSRVFALKRVLRMVAEKAYIKYHTLLISVLIFRHNRHVTTSVYPMNKLHGLLQLCPPLLELSCLIKLVDKSHSNRGLHFDHHGLSSAEYFTENAFPPSFSKLSESFHFPCAAHLLCGGFTDHTNPR